MTDSDAITVTRRSVLKTTAAAGATAASGTAFTGATLAQDADLESWLGNTSNFDGVVDETGSSDVTVDVGSQANGGSFGFGPAAVRVEPGTTVTWEWVAGSHNVVADDGSYESDLTNEAGFTFSQTFDQEGVSKYYCVPHESMGMKGAIVVGSGDTASKSGGSDSGGGGDGGSDSGGGEGALTTSDVGVLAFAGALVGGLLSPLALRATRRSSKSPETRR